MQHVEIVSANSTSVSCQGKETLLDHPLVYLEIDPIQKSIDCPYCGKKFVLSA